MSAINITETVTVLRATGSQRTREDLVDLITRMGVVAADFTTQDAAEVAFVLETARAGNAGPTSIGLADAVCLATARRLGLPVVVSDSAWEILNLGIEIVPFR